MSTRPIFLANNRALLFASIAVAVAVLFFPMRQLVAQRHHIADLQTRLTKLNAENAKLSDQAHRLSDPSEMQLLARERLGLIRPGERAYFIQSTVPTATPAPAAPEAKHGTSGWTRAWHWLTKIVRGRH